MEEYWVIVDVCVKVEGKLAVAFCVKVTVVDAEVTVLVNVDVLGTVVVEVNVSVDVEENSVTVCV